MQPIYKFGLARKLYRTYRHECLSILESAWKSLHWYLRAIRIDSRRAGLPYKVGDRVLIDEEQWGTVSEIQLRIEAYYGVDLEGSDLGRFVPAWRITDRDNSIKEHQS